MKLSTDELAATVLAARILRHSLERGDFDTDEGDEAQTDLHVGRAMTALEFAAEELTDAEDGDVVEVDLGTDALNAAYDVLSSDLAADGALRPLLDAIDAHFETV